MRKNKVFATAAIAALAAAQMAMPVMAAKTNNGLEKVDKDNPQYTDQQLKQDGHTLFSVFESKTDVADQVSFTVPLYVTMAAVQGQKEMKVPTGYYIENTSKDVAKIGVTKVDVTALGWDIVASADAIAAAPNKQTTMTFELTNADKTKKLAFKALNKKESKTMTDYKDETVSNLFITAGDTTDKNTINPIEKKLDLGMRADIDATATREDTATVGAFKVVYSISALTDDNKPKANTYVGDNKTEAYKYQKPTVIK